MNAAHKAFFERPEARPLEALIRQPELVRAYLEFCHAEIPPVQAIVREAEPLILALPAKDRPYAIQSCGALVGDILVKQGLRLRRTVDGKTRRGRIRNSRFIKTGTMFEAPSASPDPHFDEAMRIAREAMVKYRTVFEALAK